jgi:hypothetical protein
MVPSPSEAPWSVLVSMRNGDSVASCSGTIIDATHVLTAAHCTHDKRNVWRPPSAYTVIAGISDTSKDGDHREEQVRAVSSVRVEPSYLPGEPGADVALLSVDPPYDLTEAGIAAIGLVDENGAPPVGSTVKIFGWGQIEDGHVDGRLHNLDQGLLEQWWCTTGVPSILCAWSGGGAPCAGDSGGGLVTASDPPFLIGISNMVIAPSSPCAAGNLTVYTDLSTPEIHSWLAGTATPPQAPRTGLRALLRGVLFSGGRATCDAPSWSGDPQVTTKFLYVTPGSYATQVVQNGPSNEYELGPEDVGHLLVCVSVAANSAGTTESASWPPAMVGGRSTELVKVRRAERRGRKWRVWLKAAPSLRRSHIKVRWAGPRCASCPATRQLPVEKLTRLVSPPILADAARLTVRLPGLAVGAIPYRASTLRVRFGVRAEQRRSVSRRSGRLLGLARARKARSLPRHAD